MWTEGLMLSITYTKNHIWSNFKRFWTPKSEQFTAKCLQILTANLFYVSKQFFFMFVPKYFARKFNN